MRTLLKRFARNERGVTIIEFAYIAPTFLVLLMGGMDLGYRSYIQGVLSGEVQKAARDATLEGGGINAPNLDNQVREQTSRVVGSGTFSFERKFYPSFTRAGQAENFTDGNMNGFRNAGECFSDENGNGVWDANGGRGGQGGADDIVVYTASVSYPRMFPMYGLLGWAPTQTISATTVLRNQPFGASNTSPPETVCT